MAPDDAQKRCHNCIRLKKDCFFQPVDNRTPEPGRPSKSGPGSKPQTRAPSIIDPLPLDSSDRDPNRMHTLPSNAIETPSRVEPSIAGSAPGAGTFLLPELFLQSSPCGTAQIGSPDYSFHPGFLPQGPRTFSVPNAPYHEQAWKIPEAGPPEAFGQYPPPPVSTTSQYPGGAPYAFSQNQRESQFGHQLRSNSASWEVERAQYPQMAGGTIPVSVAQGQGIVYSAPFSQSDAQHQYATSPTHYPGGAGPYMPSYAGPQEHWQQYGPAAQYVGRHDSAFHGAWPSGLGGMDPNHHVHSGGPDPYRKGSNHPG